MALVLLLSAVGGLGTGVCGVPAAQAQGLGTSTEFIDGATVGVGLNFYQGDLDGNPDGKIIPFLTSGNVDLRVGVDHRLGKGFAAGLNFSYDRFSGENSKISFANNAFSLVVEGRFRLPVFPGRPVQVFAGAGPVLLAPHYYAFPQEASDRYRKLGTRFAFFAPVGVLLWERLRLGMKLSFTDYLDGFRGNEPEDQDVFPFINLAYRFGSTR